MSGTMGASDIFISCLHIFDVKQTENCIVTFCVNCGKIKEVKTLEVVNIGGVK